MVNMDISVLVYKICLRILKQNIMKKHFKNSLKW